MNTALSPKKDVIAEAIERSKRTGKEFCNCCGTEMSFLLTTNIDNPVRFQGGAYYREGAGQTCGKCEAGMGNTPPVMIF